MEQRFGIDAAKQDLRKINGAKLRSPFGELGCLLDGNITSAEVAIHKAGLDWTVDKRQLDYKGTPVAAWGIFRQDTDTFLSSVGSEYTEIQNVKGFEWPDALLSNEGQTAHYVAAGELDGGKNVFVVIRMPSLDLTVGKNDKSQGYLIYSNSHGGKSALISVVELRLACMNGSVVVEKEDNLFKIRHRRNAISRMDEAKKGLTILQARTRKLEDRLNKLSRKQLDIDSTDRIMKKLFGDNYLESQNWRKKEQVAKIASLFHLNDNGVFPEQAGTAYAMYNAFTDYTDHHRQMREVDAPNSQRVQAAYFGSGVEQKMEALEIIEEITEHLPEVAPTVTMRQDKEVTSMIDNILANVNH